MEADLKKSFRSAEKNLTPLEASKMVLLRRSFVSRRDAAGELAVELYSRQSPPTVRQTPNSSLLSGRLRDEVNGKIFFCVSHPP